MNMNNPTTGIPFRYLGPGRHSAADTAVSSSPLSEIPPPYNQIKVKYFLI